MKMIQFYSIGTEIWDDLTNKPAKIVGVSYLEGKTPQSNCVGAIGYWLDNDYLGGGRQAWEISELPKNQPSLVKPKLIKADFGPDAGKNLKNNLFED